METRRFKERLRNMGAGPAGEAEKPKNPAHGLRRCMYKTSCPTDETEGDTVILNFEAVGERLDQIAERFPPVFYRDLNGGICLLPDCREDPQAPSGELYRLGEYRWDAMGRYINLYYGSFAALAQAERWSEEEWEKELYDTLAHEFTHHMESLAGERGLERRDEEFMEDFWQRHGR